MNPAEQVRSLSVRKQAIEAELEAQLSILTANSSTLSSPLVDPEGFPRSDIDVSAVRGARVRIIGLRNDLKAVMDEIGKALELVYDPGSLGPIPGGSQTFSEKSTPDGPMRPFAKVDDVAPNSPAGTAVRNVYLHLVSIALNIPLPGITKRRFHSEIWPSDSAVLQLIIAVAGGRIGLCE
jgi:26S proteasome regulatory subunit N4